MRRRVLKTPLGETLGRRGCGKAVSQETCRDSVPLCGTLSNRARPLDVAVSTIYYAWYAGMDFTRAQNHGVLILVPSALGADCVVVIVR